MDTHRLRICDFFFWVAQQHSMPLIGMMQNDAWPSWLVIGCSWDGLYIIWLSLE